MIKASVALLAALSISSCKTPSGPSVARTFTLYTVDRNILPAPIKGLDGKTVTIGVGRLQGTDIGPKCGMSLQLISGPITAIDVPDCKLVSGQEFTFMIALSDSRFPAGSHEYRFVPP